MINEFQSKDYFHKGEFVVYDIVSDKTVTDADGEIMVFKSQKEALEYIKTSFLAVPVNYPIELN